MTTATVAATIAMIARTTYHRYAMGMSSRSFFILVFMVLLSHYTPGLELSGARGDTSASRTDPCEKIAGIFKLLGIERQSKCAYPRRISITPNPTQTTAITRNAGTYSDPSHATYA